MTIVAAARYADERRLVFAHDGFHLRGARCLKQRIATTATFVEPGHWRLSPAERTAAPRGGSIRLSRQNVLKICRRAPESGATRCVVVAFQSRWFGASNSLF